MIEVSPKMYPGAAQNYSSELTVRSEHRDKPYPYPARLDWDANPNMEHWNEICAWTIEHMGLPGDKYHTEITTDYMIWYFSNQLDQLIFILAWGNDGN
jgi:hypothetical protein